MKITLYVVGGLLDLIGSVWFLQGINVLPGSFMTGDIHWAIYGGITAIVGGLVVFAGSRRQKSRKG
jgi:hypothetical protein